MNKGLAKIVLLFLVALSLISTAFAVSEDNSILRVDFISQTPDPVEPGTYVDLRWRVTNLGGKSEDYVFQLIEDYPFSVDQQTSSEITSKSVVGYQSADYGATLYFRARVDASAVEGDNTIRLQYFRADGSGEKTIVTQSIRVESTQGLANIGNVVLTPTEISAGEPFKLNLDVENLATNFISNVKVSIDADKAYFIPFGDTNQKTINRISGKGVHTYSFDYFVDASAPVKVHSVPVTVTFSDSLGRETTLSTTIGIPVSAKSEYLANLERTEIFMAGQKGKVVASISNIGKSDLNFVVLKLKESEDYEIIGTDTSYLGNLESDDFETGQFEIYVRPTVTGSVPLSFVLTYKDAYDQIHTKDVTLTNKIYDQQTAKQIGLIPASNGGVLLIVGLVVIAVIVFWIIRRKKKAQR
ncbi:MAG TPA: hypothetical protein VK158_01815 [Acidobacteriota bacterium]|nr:hypothetical protein [Acidobacteriota bacterium]